MNQAEAVLPRVTAGEALDRVVRTLTERRPIDEVLQEILEQSRAMLDAAEAYVLLKAGERLVIRASVGLEIGDGGQNALPATVGLEGLAASTGTAVTSSDLASDPRHVDLFHRRRPVRSLLAVPLILRGVLLGVLVCTRLAPGRFADVERWWLEIFGGLIASVIASDQAYRNQERRARQAETLLALSTSADGDPISPRTVAEVARAFGQSACGILMADASQSTYRLLFRPADPAREVVQATLSAAECGALHEVVRTGQPLVSADIPATAGLRDLPFLEGGRRILASPIQVSGQNRGVVFVVSDRSQWLDGDDSAFLALLATRIGLLIEQGELRQRQIEIERQRAQTEARQEFLGVVSHELKTPVAVMRAYTELLLRRAEKAGRSSEVDILRRMSDQAERMLAMIEQLLDSRRLEGGLLTLEVGHFDLSELIRRVVHDVEVASRFHQIQVETPGRITIRADRRRIEEVVTNLLDNAIKYSPPGGTVRIRLTRETGADGEEYALLAVSDDGPGIPEQDRERIFERFYQAPARLHRGHAGLGLGLYISRELVRRHGGDVWVESQEGQGSTFYVRLPLAGPQPLD
ncbi:MAG: GAF domain-containing protein [Chloroflexi bacterium]|nr:GAF domain-containing protein [Chloroflexota bacterium]